MVNLSGGMHPVASDKTIAGMGGGAGITDGGFNLKSVHNVIIQNLAFYNGDDDNINVEIFSHHIWIHHNTFKSTSDGSVDIKRGSSFVTVSYNHFDGIYKTALIGHNDGNAEQDSGNLKVTYHHNYFQNCRSRQPRVRFGEVHIYNNYYQNIQNYGIGVGVESRVYSENNHKEGGEVFYQLMTNGGSGALKDVGSIGGSSYQPERVTWNPKDRYKYRLDPAGDVKSIVVANAGVGKIGTSNITTNNHPIPKAKRNNSRFSDMSTYDLKGRRVPQLERPIGPGVYFQNDRLYAKYPFPQ
jgi:pectate lyase